MKKLRNYIQWLRLKHAVKKANKFHNLTGYKYFGQNEDRSHQSERQCHKKHEGHEGQDPFVISRKIIVKNSVFYLLTSVYQFFVFLHVNS